MLFERERERREQLLWKRRAGKRERVGLARIKNNTHTKSGGALFFYFDQQQKSGTFSRSLNEREQKRKQRALCKDSLPEVIFRFDQKIRVGGRVFFFSKTIFSLCISIAPRNASTPQAKHPGRSTAPKQCARSISSASSIETSTACRRQEEIRPNCCHRNTSTSVTSPDVPRCPLRRRRDPWPAARRHPRRVRAPAV
jgi:hypothetical protein